MMTPKDRSRLRSMLMKAALRSLHHQRMKARVLMTHKFERRSQSIKKVSNLLNQS